MTTVPLAKARAQLSHMIDEAMRTHDLVSITRNGVPAAVLMSQDEYESMVATIEVLADTELIDRLREAIAEAGEFSQEDLDASMRAVGRR